MESYLNYKNKYSNLIMLTFGTGVGGGIISEGRLLRGSGNAGEVGHMLTSNDRDVMGDSGKKGSFETSVAASVWTKKCYELTEKNQDSELAKAFALKNIGSEQQGASFVDLLQKSIREISISCSQHINKRLISQTTKKLETTE